jgi:hypothetical protein
MTKILKAGDTVVKIKSKPKHVENILAQILGDLGFKEEIGGK